MNEIKVNKAELLATVKKNRDAHRAIFEKACEGYRSKAVAELEAMLTEARAGKQIRRGLSLVEPMDQTRDYDRVIRMLEMSVSTEVELGETEFSQYVMDDWQWKRQFTLTNSAYTGG